MDVLTLKQLQVLTQFALSGPVTWLEMLDSARQELPVLEKVGLVIREPALGEKGHTSYALAQAGWARINAALDTRVRLKDFGTPAAQARLKDFSAPSPSVLAGAIRGASSVAPPQERPSVLYRPELYIDGNQWCARYGANLQEGVAGFGDSPGAAMREFDKAWERAL